jgi:hypothetical protein
MSEDGKRGEIPFARPRTLRTRRGDYEVPHLMRWAERAEQPCGEPVPLVGRDSNIAAIGSCFAERVTEVLAAMGLRATFHPAGLQYNTFSLVQEMRHLFGDSPYSDDDLVEGTPGRWVHPFRKAFEGSSREDVLSMQQRADEQARRAYREADLIIVTLGLTEIWQRRSDGLVAVELPPRPVVDDFVFRNSTTADNLANLEKLRGLIRGVTDAPILLTVSPVPLHATFRRRDVVVANCESKSILRAAAADFLAQHNDVHYFSSFELVPQWHGDGPFFLEDGRHVSPQGVAFILNEFLRTYGKGDMRPEYVPFGEVEMPDQTLGRRFKNLRSRVAKKARKIRGREG